MGGKGGGTGGGTIPSSPVGEGGSEATEGTGFKWSWRQKTLHPSKPLHSKRFDGLCGSVVSILQG